MTRLQKIVSLRQGIITDSLIEQLTAIREYTVAHLPELAANAKETLEGKLAKVYLARDQSEATRILKDLLKNEKQVARSFSNTLGEIEFDKLMANQGVKTHLTRIEEIVREQMGAASSRHPHLTALDVKPGEIKEALSGFVEQPADLTEPELKRMTAEKIKDRILHCEYGITGANSLVAENGVMILAEDEGNIRAVSNLPYRHVAVVGIDKINWSVEDCMTVIQATAIFGTGRNTPTYFSLIAGPSRTADIEFRMAYGMHGPKEVHVILLDNGRLSIRNQGAGSLLKCINCGSCYESCMELASKQEWQEVVASPKAFALGIVQGKIPALQTKEDMADFSCPVGLSNETVISYLGEIRAM